MSDFNSLDLHPVILSALSKKGYTNPTPIQAQAIPHLLKGKDLLGIAQTGTGKTAAFSLPIINRLAKKKVKARPARMRALILTPTRELAAQIEQSIKDYGKGLALSSLVIFGGVGAKPQVQAMARGVDILVATPGRLLDLMSEGHILFNQLEVFVLDEADRMLDMGFINDVKKVVQKLPKEKQTLLFSATMPKDISALASKMLNKPVRVEVTPESTTVEKIDQKVNLVEKSNKPLLLKSILKSKTIKSALVFTRTKYGADRVVRHLERAYISAAAIHGNKSQGAREKALGSFRKGNIKVLVATDIAARGIDIPQVTHVINYDIPADPKSYVHRIGRTARAGREGIAISFCDKTEESALKSVEKCIKCKINVDTTHPYHGVAPQVVKQNSQQGQQKGKPNTKRPNNHRRRRPNSERK